MNTVIFLFRVSRRIRPAETYRKRLSSIFRYLSEMRKRLFSPCDCVLIKKVLKETTNFMRKSQVNDSLLRINFIFKSLSFPNFLHMKYQKADNSIETAVTSIDISSKPVVFFKLTT